MSIPTLQDQAAAHAQPPMGNSVAAAIAARGKLITLLTGERVRLRYSMLSLEQLEADFGNLAGIISHVEDAAKALQASEKVRLRQPLTDDEQALVANTSAGRIFTAISRVLIPGLIDAKATDPRDPDRGPQWLEGNPALCKRVLDPGQLADYMSAFQSAFTESFDTGATPAGPTQPALATLPAPGSTVGSLAVGMLTETHPSPGAPGTTSPVGPLGVQTPSSGA